MRLKLSKAPREAFLWCPPSIGDARAFPTVTVSTFSVDVSVPLIVLWLKCSVVYVREYGFQARIL